MWFFVLWALLAVGGGYVGRRVVRHAAERRRRQHAAGASTRLSVRARGRRPFPRWWAWGSIWTGDEPLVFRRWHRMLPEAPLTGLTLVRRAIDTDAPKPSVLFQFRDAEGRRAEISVGEDDADLFESALRPPARPGGLAPRRAVPVGPLAVAAAALLWLLAWAYLAAAGTVVSATVLANDEQSCHVRWTLDDRTDEATVDCYDEQPGQAVEVLALPAPFRGEATDTDFTPVAVVFVFGLGTLPLLVTGASRLLRRRRSDVVLPGPGPVTELDVPHLEPHELRYSRVAEVLERRAAAEDWAATAAPPWWARRISSPGGRLAAARLGWVVGTVLFTLFVAALFGSTAVRTALLFDASRARETVATVTEVTSFVPLVPHDVAVEFEVAGRVRHATIASTGEPDIGDRIAIRYDAARPDAARRVGGDDGVARGLQVAGGLAAAGLAFLLWHVVAVVRELRVFRRSHAEPATTMRYALVLDPLGDVLMLLAGLDGDPRPELLVPLGPLPRGVPISGTAEVHGRVEPEATVVVRVGERLLYPAEPVLEIDEEDLGPLVSGGLADEDE